MSSECQESLVPQPATESESWAVPVPLAEVAAVMGFPVDVLPVALADFVRQVQKTLGCPIDYVGLPLLVLSGAAIGSSRVLEFKPGFRERACLFGALIGRSGSGKTAALNALTAPLHDWQRQLDEQFAKDLEAYPQVVATFKMACIQNYTGKGELTLSGEPPPPVPRRAFYRNGSVGHVRKSSVDHPEGLVYLQDDLTDVLGTGFTNQRDKREEQQFFQEAWSATGTMGNHEEPPFLAVLGGLTPIGLDGPVRRRTTAEGCLDRFLIAFPDAAPAAGWNWDGVGQETAATWNESFTKLLRERDGGVRRLHLTECGRQAWEEFMQRMTADMTREDFPEGLWGAWTRLKVYGGRLALLIHVLRRVHQETTVEDVDGESVRRAGRLVEYFQDQAWKFHAARRTDAATIAARRVLRWIERNGARHFTKRDVFRALCRTIPKTYGLDRPLAALVEHGYIRQAPVPARQGPGQRPSPAYEVNPLWNSVNSGNSVNKVSDAKW